MIGLVGPSGERLSVKDDARASRWEARGYRRESAGLDEMTKADLLDLAEQRGVEVSQSWTKAEIVSALED